ncbi:hypothetical protein F5Y12DRAFT_759905 [Xylaria sp. FL1777]|nr:hypothetical protein F5Y12DRAFT_759905 [Xylaria sp. FL1777]
MDVVPPEILLHIFKYIDGPAPSDVRLHDEPSIDLLANKAGRPTPYLKTASLVSRFWRSLIMPRLFRHILWKPRVYSLSAFTLNPLPLLRFLTENHLAHNVMTFTLAIDFYDPVPIFDQVAPRIRSVDLEWLWDQLFSVIDPLRFTILARPTTLASLLSCMLYLNDAGSFDIPYHILSISRTTRQSSTKSDRPSINTSSDIQPATPSILPTSRRLASSSTSIPRAVASCPLFTVRPWTSLLLNEGSFDKVYLMDEFYLRRPPSILGALLGCEEYPNNVSLIPRTMVDFNYIAIFPLSSHFSILLEHLPRIDRLFVQLTPKPESSILENSDEMKHIDLSELWHQRETSYTGLIRQLKLSATSRTNWRLLRVFESGDVVDSKAWEMDVQFFERTETTEWKVERPGVFTKHTNDQSLGCSGEVNGHIGGLSNAF